MRTVCAFLREGENEMQKQRRLQHSGGDVAPIDSPVEIVQLAGVLEGVSDERNQAENIKVRGTGSSPAAQQNVKSDAQIDQRNQPQPVVERTLGRNQDDAGIERHRLPEQRIGRFRPDAVAVELALQPRHVLDFLAVDGNQLVAGLDAAFGARSAGIDAVGGEASAVFHPPDAVVGNRRTSIRNRN